MLAQSFLEALDIDLGSTNYRVLNGKGLQWAWTAQVPIPLCMEIRAFRRVVDQDGAGTLTV